MPSLRRLVPALVLLLVLLPAATAFAQYPPFEPPPSSTTTTTRSTTTTTEDSGGETVGGGGGAEEETTTTTQAPPPARQAGAVSNDTPAPGDTVVVSASPTGGDPAFDADKPIASGMTSADGLRTVDFQPTLVVRDDGTVEVRINIPAGTPDGLYYVFVVGTGADGKPRVVVAAVVVTTRPGVAAASSQRREEEREYEAAARSSSIVVPAEVKALQASRSAAEVAEIEDAVRNDGATMTIDGEELVVHRPSEQTSTLVLVGGVVGVIAGGIVLLRRRGVLTGRRS